MENRQRTPLALAIEEIKDQIKKSASEKIRGGDYRIGLTKAINILESLKPKEMDIINNAFLDGYCIIQNDNIHSNNYCQQTLTQE